MLPGVDHEALLRTAFAMVGEDDAEDVVQSAYVKALSGPKHQGLSSVQTWMISIVRNVARDHLRALRRRDTLPLVDQAVQPISPRPRLPEHLEIVWAAYEAGYSQREAAGMAGVTRKVYGERLEEARQWLKEQM